MCTLLWLSNWNPFSLGCAKGYHAWGKVVANYGRERAEGLVMIFYPFLSCAGSGFSLSPSALTWVAVDLSLALLVIVVLIIACFTWKSYSRKRIKEQKVSSQHALCTLDLWKHAQYKQWRS